MISVEGVRVVYGRTVALDDLNVDFGPGITGLFGQNGSGKTTLLRTIAGLLRPARGRVAIAGRNVHPADEASRGLIGYVGHEPGLYERLTVRENLELFAGLHGTGTDRIAELLEALDLDRFAHTPAEELSAGTSRRAAVARALVHDPRVLLLDEPYANLDDDAAALVSESIQTWAAPERAAVIATHGAKKVKAFADAGVILRDGRIVVAGDYRRAEVR